jgi:hypothetical protein
LAALATPGKTVLARPAVLLAAGPGWFNRVIEAAMPTSPVPGLRDLPRDPRRWPAWFWGVLVGVGMVVAGLGAAAIALGPVLLWYDRDYLGVSVDELHDINHHLIGFLQHDRITMAGNMLGIGTLYIALAWGGIRQGRVWARNALLISGTVTFLTLFYFLVTGFIEPLHTLVVIVLFPMFVFAVWRKPTTAHWQTVPEGPESERRRALWGQLLMIGVGGGLSVAGAVISTVGLTSVFVATDLGFLGIESGTFTSAHPRLTPFIAHDRAAFGGALVGAGLAVLLISLWGWRRDERWVWWSLLIGCAAGTAPPLAIHLVIGYTTFEHLLPLYVLVMVTALARLCRTPTSPRVRGSAHYRTTRRWRDPMHSLDNTGRSLITMFTRLLDTLGRWWVATALTSFLVGRVLPALIPPSRRRARDLIVSLLPFRFPGSGFAASRSPPGHRIRPR